MVARLIGYSERQAGLGIWDCCCAGAGPLRLPRSDDPLPLDLPSIVLPDKAGCNCLGAASLVVEDFVCPDDPWQPAPCGD